MPTLVRVRRGHRRLETRKGGRVRMYVAPRRAHDRPPHWFSTPALSPACGVTKGAFLATRPRGSLVPTPPQTCCCYSLTIPVRVCCPPAPGGAAPRPPAQALHRCRGGGPPNRLEPPSRSQRGTSGHPVKARYAFRLDGDPARRCPDRTVRAAPDGSGDGETYYAAPSTTSRRRPYLLRRDGGLARRRCGTSAKGDVSGAWVSRRSDRARANSSAREKT